MLKSNNVRLLLKDIENITHAVPVNDDMTAQSGLQGESLGDSLNDARDTLERLGATESVSTVRADGERFFVAKSITEIFTLAADAARTGAPVVDMANDSGEQAIVSKAAAAKQSRKR